MDTTAQQLAEYDARFDEKIQDVKAGPVQERSYTDTCCVVVFVVLLLAIVSLGIYMLSSGSGFIAHLANQATVNSRSTANTVQIGPVLAKNIGVIIGMIVLSVALSIVFLLLIKAFPTCMVYTMVVLTFLIYLALIITGIVFAIYALTIIFGALALINACILYYCADYISVGIALLKVSNDFISEKPSVYLISCLILFLTAILEIFYVASYLGGYGLVLNNPGSNYEALLYVWYVLGIFFGFMIYYCMVFLIAVCVAYWYYQFADVNIFRGFVHLRYHIGSITFASIVITFLTILRRLYIKQTTSSSSGGIVGICLCLLAFILCWFQNLMKVLNHNSIIVMSVTAQGYIDSGRSAISLIYKNFGIFYIVDFISGFVGIYSLLVCVLIPSIIGGYITYTLYSGNQAINAGLIVGIVIMLLSLFISDLILGILQEVLSCVFILYCLDKKFQTAGFPMHNIPTTMRELFDGMAIVGSSQSMVELTNPRNDNPSTKYLPQNQQQANISQGYPQQANPSQGYPQQGYPQIPPVYPPQQSVNQYTPSNLNNQRLQQYGEGNHSNQDL